MLPRAAVAVVFLACIVGALSACTPAPRATDAGRASSGVVDEHRAPADDTWDGHFDARAAELETSASVAWGSFGSADNVATAGFTDATLAAGEHSVSVECAGPETVSVEVTPGGDAAARAGAVTADVACPGGAILAITTGVEGITVSVDSHGKPGAYLIATDSGTPSG